MYIHEIYLILFYDIDSISFGYQAFTNIPKWVPFPPYLTMKKSVEEKLFVSWKFGKTLLQHTSGLMTFGYGDLITNLVFKWIIDLFNYLFLLH